MFKGVYTALVSPFKEGAIDLESYENLIKKQIENGIDGFVINGTTAESPCLYWNEVEEFFHRARKTAKDLPLIIGCGSNGTNKTVELANKAETLKPEALLVVVPYYNRPNQEGIYQHFKYIHDNTKTPIILYNVPGRTVASMQPETCARLAKLERIVGIKDATGDLEYLKKERESTASDFIILSGEDQSFVDFSLGGGDGCISVISQIIPQKMKAWFEQAQRNEKSCMADFNKYKNLCALMFAEPNPVPVKYALYRMGLIASGEVRLPLVEPSETLKKKIDQELSTLEFI